MPKILLEFSVPEDPDRNTVTVAIEGPHQREVVRTAMRTIDHYTAPRPSGILRLPGERTECDDH